MRMLMTLQKVICIIAIFVLIDDFFFFEIIAKLNYD